MDPIEPAEASGSAPSGRRTRRLPGGLASPAAIKVGVAVAVNSRRGDSSVAGDKKVAVAEIDAVRSALEADIESESIRFPSKQAASEELRTELLALT